jgi:hypothetical protein
MKRSRVSAFAPAALFGAMLSAMVVAPAAAMVDFESYPVATDFIGYDGWTYYGSAAATTITPDYWLTPPDERVLAGLQSARIWDTTIVGRPFDAGPTEYGTGTTLSARMMVDGASGSGEFYFSQNIAAWGTPAGIVGHAGGNFDLYGRATGGSAVVNIPTSVPFFTNTTYLLEIELNLENQSFDAYATNLTTPGPRTSLGTAYFGGTVAPASYTTGGFCLTSLGAVAIYDELDIDVVPPGAGDELLPGTVDFEASKYVAGQSVIGVDGWHHYLGATAVVTTDALEGSKSLGLSGTRSIAYRHFGPGTTYDDNSMISAKMMADVSSPAGSTSEFFFSHNPETASTPAGIVGVVGGNFWVWGIEDGAIVTKDGIETDVQFLSDVEYLLELELDMTNQTFDSYVTNLTADGPRVSLGTAEFWSLDLEGNPVVIPPGDDTNSGFILVTRTEAVATFDDLSVGIAPPPPDLLGDANDDGVVNDKDASILGAHWHMQSGATWADGDFNKDQKVDDRDAAIMAAHWLETSGGEGSVPEPSTLVLLAGLALGAVIVRRRRPE